MEGTWSLKEKRSGESEKIEEEEIRDHGWPAPDMTKEICTCNTTSLVEKMTDAKDYVVGQARTQKLGTGQNGVERAATMLDRNKLRWNQYSIQIGINSWTSSWVN
ncbi:hypothetical protein H6P81_019219 [Aristolochia fimbriata]|uniref:Uncharacterized protein n=1 Tax=Aristolochia fimbriata TaxID=158543 RepID=A0AAV7DR67_ARIFI|nr:hypothetical protein H6P81_019219 [Aristolochia fimbriata]